MPLGLPTNSEEIEDRLKSDVALSAPDSNPYAANHWLLALIVGLGRRLFDFTRDLQRAVDFAFPDTTFDEGITRWASIYGKSQQAATQSSGNAIATGTATSVIPIATVLSTTVTATDGTTSSITFETTSAAVIAESVLSVSSINLSGQTATVVTDVEHELSNNVSVTISGALEAEYNVIDAIITVINSTTFTYEIEGSPTSPATGTIEATFTSAAVPVISQDFGENTNLSSGATLTLQSPVAGVDNTMGIDASGTIGGTDQETLDSLKERTLVKIQNPVAHFNANDIESIALKVPTVARVFVQVAGSEISTFSITSITNDTGSPVPIAKATASTAHGLLPGDFTTITGAAQVNYNVTSEAVIILDDFTFAYPLAAATITPATGTITGTGNVPLGSVRVYFITDDDDDVIPSSGLVTAVFEQILTILPATTSQLDLNVIAPTAVSTDFTFTALSPSTESMETAVLANLKAFFADQTTVGVDVQEDAYRAAIINTVDIDTGARVESFALSAPSGNIVIGNGEIATLGAVVFP